MPSHAPRTVEAYKQKELLLKREEQLRHALWAQRISAIVRKRDTWQSMAVEKIIEQYSSFPGKAL